MISKPQIYFAYHYRHKYFPNSSNVFISHKFLPSITQTKCRKKVEELKAHTTNWNNIYRLYSAAPSSVFLLPRFNKDISTLSFRKIVYGVRCFDSSQCRVENILMVYTYIRIYTAELLSCCEILEPFRFRFVCCFGS